MKKPRLEKLFGDLCAEMSAQGINYFSVDIRDGASISTWRGVGESHFYTGRQPDIKLASRSLEERLLVQDDTDFEDLL